MATTTASITISSSDLQPGNSLSINGTSELMQTGLTTGLELVEMGNAKVTVGGPTEHALIEALGTADSSNYLYLCNTSTEDAYYLEVGIHETVLGYLGAGDWMFIPWNNGDTAAEIEVQAINGTNTLEYAVFKTAWTLPTATA
tara:strand:+ start:214 stop:642 length:429 start_codon:yes stop_codon:yes gene_type:complete